MNGRVHAVSHPRLIAGLVGLDLPGVELDEPALAWEIETIAELWSTIVSDTPWDLIDAPTPSRERSSRLLALNVFWFLELARAARSSGRYNPLDDLATDTHRNATIVDQRSLQAFVREHADAWSMFALDWYPPDGSPEPGAPVETRGGIVTFAELLSSQRSHAAIHLLQTTVFLARHGYDYDVDPVLATMPGLMLPDDPYGSPGER